MLWSRYTRSRCRVRGARTRGHVCTCSIAIEADQSSFQLYSSGMLTVLAVGYGTNAGADCWKVKHSCESSWGEQVTSDSSGKGGADEWCILVGLPSYPSGVVSQRVVVCEVAPVPEPSVLIDLTTKVTEVVYGWPVVVCGWPEAVYGWPEVVCGWPVVVHGWPGFSLQAVHGWRDQKQGGGDVPRYIKMAARAASARLSADGLQVVRGWPNRCTYRR